MVVLGASVLETLGAIVDESVPGTAEEALLAIVGPVGAGTSDEAGTVVLVTDTDELLELEELAGAELEPDSLFVGAEDTTELEGRVCARTSWAIPPKSPAATTNETVARRRVKRCLVRAALRLVGYLALMDSLGTIRCSKNGSVRTIGERVAPDRASILAAGVGPCGDFRPKSEVVTRS
jgi:hypothetical protein